MQIKDMFRKKIDREIQGVIIVGQGEETNVAQELEEYVVTRELQRHFADFFAAYKKGIQGTTPKMGVWISGFFGSGKSHFLKILSYLLQNKQVGDKHAIDYFIEDQKITNQMVLADMQLAANTPSDVILFNIDSKSDSNGKENKDAIVNVFLKVFNEMQGFCGSMPHLADLERRLSEEGRFEEFKEKFEEEYGDPWESSRQDFDFIQDSVVDVLSDMDFMSESAARNWCEKATEGYQISIEDFAKRVKSYIDKKGNNHHVVFLVDEIGQYIGDDSKLMLNLQTVTEELGKECMGKAWVIVTSQQDIDSITKVKGNDFSKIQGRFDTRLSLSSANVDAVIKKRILDKTETAAQSLRLLYDQKATIIKNLIVFNDGVEKKLYANAEDFAEVYLTEALKEATIYVNGDVLHTSGKEVTSRINEAIGRLVQTVYHKLSYIDVAMGEADIRKMFKTSNQLSLALGDTGESNVHALDDVLQFVAGNSRMHMKTSMKTIKDRFMKAPYGFVEDDIHWLVARLFKRGDLSFTVNGESVNLNNRSEEEIIGYITKKQFVDKLLTEVRVRVPENQKKAVRTVMKELFKVAPPADDEDTIMKNFQHYCENRITEIERLEPKYENYAYPGKELLEKGKKRLSALVQIQAPLEFFKTVFDEQDDLMDFGEDYEPIRDFFGSEQLTIFTRALDMLNIYEDSKTYIVDAELEDVVAKMRTIVRMAKPYKEIPKLPELREKFMNCYMRILEEQAEPVKDSINQDRNRVFEVLNTKPYKDARFNRYLELFKEIMDGAEHCNNVSTLRSYADKAEALKLRLLNEMNAEDIRLAKEAAAKAEAERKRQEEEAKKRGEAVKPEEKVAEPQPVYKVRTTKNVSIKTVAKTASWRLESKDDIDKYLAALRENLLKEMDEDTIVNIEL